MINTSTLRAHHITEKASKLENVYVFKVSPDATKQELKRLIETLYEVEVEKINTLNQGGKQKMSRGRKGRRADFKKAYVRLKSGYSIDLQESI